VNDWPPGTSARYPDYNVHPLPPDAKGMSFSAFDVARSISLGLNIGDTLEAYGGKTETWWDNPRISVHFLRFVKSLGFDAVRLPVSWNQYSHARTARIDDRWLQRVAEVVGHCVDSGLFVVVNIHWDGGWLEDHVNRRAAPRVAARLSAFWQQIATALRAFDHRLLFAGMNEPKVDSPAQMAILELYHQTFVDTVRATGGRNSHRCLVLPGPTTDIAKTVEWLHRLPSDAVSHRLMLEVHYYTPWNFTGLMEDEHWGRCFHYWGKANHSSIEPERNATWGEEDDMAELFGRMAAKAQALDVPVLLAEYSARDRGNIHHAGPVPLDFDKHHASLNHYVEVVTRRARLHGMAPFYWDTGALLDRRFCTAREPDRLAALRRGASSGFDSS
jgi:endoglucanase